LAELFHCGVTDFVPRCLCCCRVQVEIYEFEKTELNSQEEMEKQARQYAEEQLQAMQVEMQQLMQAKAAQAAQMLALKQEFEAIQRDAQEKHNAMRAAHQELAAKNAQVRGWPRAAAVRRLVSQHHPHPGQHLRAAVGATDVNATKRAGWMRCF
jgi:DNA repair exonuclease SbcCD ATPase subunit